MFLQNRAKFKNIQCAGGASVFSPDLRLYHLSTCGFFKPYRSLTWNFRRQSAVQGWLPNLFFLNNLCSIQQFSNFVFGHQLLSFQACPKSTILYLSTFDKFRLIQFIGKQHCNGYMTQYRLRNTYITMQHNCSNLDKLSN